MKWSRLEEKAGGCVKGGVLGYGSMQMENKQPVICILETEQPGKREQVVFLP